jgi:hypothetical protein
MSLRRETSVNRGRSRSRFRLLPGGHGAASNESGLLGERDDRAFLVDAFERFRHNTSAGFLAPSFRLETNPQVEDIAGGDRPSKTHLV